MLGLGHQELLLIIVIFLLVLVVFPGIFYLVVYLALTLFKSPRRVLVALWLLALVLAIGDAATSNRIGSPIAGIVVVALLAPIQIVCSFVWLFVGGWLLQKVGLSTIGTRWREMAALHLGSLRVSRRTTT